MLVISSDLVLSSGGGVNANNPLIGYHSLVTSSNVTADEEDPDYLVSNVANPVTFLKWKGETPHEQEIIIDVSSYQSDIDYLGVARHNFGSARIPISVETSLDGIAYTEVAPDVMLADDTPFMFRWSPVTVNFVKLRMRAGDAIPECAVIYVGKLLILQRRIYVGHSPVTLSRRSSVITGMSEQAEFLGRVVQSISRSTAVNMENLTPAWYRQYFDPFVEAAVDTPFFFAWRPGAYPTEVAYGWLTADVKPVNQRPNGLMSVQFQMASI